jgi:hypothetical protein
LNTSTRQKGRFWRIGRIYFRRFRITLWLVILALLGAVAYLNQIGLPDFVKRPLLEKLRARGLDLQFSRLRLSWYHGLVADNVRFGRADEPLSPHLTLAEVRLRFNRAALLRLQFQLDSLALRQGRLVWPIAGPNQPPRQLAIDHLQADLRFLPGDQWALDHFTADFAGAAIHLSGTVANASAVREWKLLQAEPAAPAGAWRNRLRQFADTLDRIHFSSPPEFRLDVRGDARDLASFAVHVVLSTPGAETPWGSVSGGRFSARLFPATTNGPASAELNLEAGQAQTRWATAANVQLTAHLASFESLTNLGNGDLELSAGQVETQWARAANLQLAVHLDSVVGQTNLVRADLALAAGRVETEWGSATNAQVNAQWTHALTNAIPLAGEGQLHCRQANTKWGAAGEARLNVRLAAAPPAAAPLRADESWAWWAKLEPYALDWDGTVSGLQSRGVEAAELACAGSWRAPKLTITNLHVELYQRQLEVRAGLDVMTRSLRLSLTSDVNPHQIAPLLTEGARRWLAPYAWETPPRLQGEVSLVLPAWTNRQPDWRAEVQPTLQLQGEFKIEHGGAYRGVPVTTAQSHLYYSNLVWRLPDLTVTRPEGRLDALYEEDDRTKDYYFRIGSTLDVRVLRPLLEPGQQRGLDYFTFTEPPVIDAEIWGRGHEPERTGIKGRVALTNFTFRGESASGLQTALQYTNRWLQFTQPRLQRGTQQLRADGLGADFLAQKIYLTNGFSTTEPMVVARAIGPQVARAIKPYQFVQPPVAHVQGIIPMHGEDDADLHFDLDGGPFDWWRFHVPHISGHAHWRGQHLTLSNVLVGFYGGQAAGSARFDFSPRDETDYEFAVTATDALLQPLTADLFIKTNRLEGRLSGTLVVTNASTVSLQSWRGYGDLSLRDGLIWDIPIFGMFSGVLNNIEPGLGSSRANAGTCTFVITNGVIRSDDMDIRSTGMRLQYMRLQYRGTLDFQGQVNARVEAGLLRDVPIVGPLVSTVLWPVTKLFEYKVTGSLGDPKAEPVYLVSKVMLLPFQFTLHPLRTLKNLLPEDITSSRTNAPPLNSPKKD